MYTVKTGHSSKMKEQVMVHNQIVEQPSHHDDISNYVQIRKTPFNH